MQKKFICSLLVLVLLFSSSLMTYAEGTDKNSKNKTEAVEVYDYITKTITSKDLLIDESETTIFSEGYTPSNIELSTGTSDESSVDFSVQTILTDPLTKAPNSTSSPYSKVIMSRNGFDTDSNGTIDYWTIGSGFMVKSKVLLTACHTIYHSSKNVWATEYRVYINQFGSSIGSTYYLPQEWTYSPNYINNKDSNYDWCVVKMQNSIGSTTGYFTYEVPSSIILKDSTITVSGYPDVLGYQYYQYYDAGTVKSTTTSRFAYDASTLGGQSGGPVYNSSKVVWGIHTTGGSTTNSGVRLNSTITSAITSYNN